MKKISITLAKVCCLVFLLPGSADSQVLSTATINFGYLYGWGNKAYPTTVTAATGSLGESLAGRDFYWSCMERGIPSPDAETVTYSGISADPSILSGGVWDKEIREDPSNPNSPLVPLMPEETRESIKTGISNMFYTFRADLLQDTGSLGNNNRPGSGFQLAVWYIAEGRDRNVWSGLLDQVAIDALILWNGGTTTMAKIETVGWIRTMLNATQTPSAGGREVFLTNSSNGVQPVILFPVVSVPEPGAVALLTGAGLLHLSRRRRH